MLHIFLEKLLIGNSLFNAWTEINWYSVVWNTFDFNIFSLRSYACQRKYEEEMLQSMSISNAFYYWQPPIHLKHNIIMIHIHTHSHMHICKIYNVFGEQIIRYSLIIKFISYFIQIEITSNFAQFYLNAQYKVARVPHQYRHTLFLNSSWHVLTILLQASALKL